MMVKQDIAERVINKTGISSQIALRAVNAVFDVLKDAMAAGERIELRGFGIFRVVNRKTGIGRNPKTGQVVSIPLGKTVKFKAGKDIIVP